MAVPTEEGRGETWWLYAVAGVVSLLFGIACLAWPGITLTVLIFLFGAFVLITGVLELIAFIGALGAHETWWTHLLLAIIGIAAAIAVFAYPGMSAVILVYVIGFWAIALGIIELIAAFTTGQFLLIAVAVISILFGLLLLANPLLGALVYILVIGVFAIIRGILLLVQAVRAPSTPAAV
jgi:uncharacterized membrane protein HdeD (DUF308 family)